MRRPRREASSNLMILSSSGKHLRNSLEWLRWPDIPVCVAIHVQIRNASAKEAQVATSVLHIISPGIWKFCISYASWLSCDLNFEFHRKTDKDTKTWMKRNETKGEDVWRFKVRWSNKVLRCILIFNPESQVCARVCAIWYLCLSVHAWPLSWIYHNWTSQRNNNGRSTIWRNLYYTT